MRNLKRALSLALASVMLLGMMVVGSSAASFPDVSNEDNTEAIAVLEAVKVMIGNEKGEFEPDKNVTRNEMAVIMAKLILGTYEADSYVGSHPFTDVPDWASKYVAACYSAGIIAGRGEGIYDGSSTVTAVEAAAMMLRALGYEDLSKGAASWDQPVAAKANEINLFEGLGGASNAPMNRDSVAQLALNTLEATMVTTIREGQDITLPDGTTIVGSRRYVLRAENYGWAGAIDTEGNSDGTYIQLGEYLYKGKLEKAEGAPDSQGRPVDYKWVYDSEEVCDVLKDAKYTLKNDFTGKDLYNTLGQTVVKSITGGDRDLNVYVDGVALDGSTTPTKTAFQNALVNKSTDKYSKSDGLNTYMGNGTRTEIFVSDDAVDVCIINTYGGEVDKVYTADDVKSDEEPYVLVNGMKFETTDFQEEDVVAYTKGKDGSKTVIASMEMATLVEGEVTKVTNTKNFTIDGKTYEFNYTLADKLTTDNVKNDVVVYLDANDYMIYKGDASESNDYAYVVSIGSEVNKYDGTKYTYYAKLLLTDGTLKDVDLKKADGWTAANSANSLKEKIVTYTEDDGKYELTVAAAGTPALSSPIADNTHLKIEQGVASMLLNSASANVSANSNTVFLVCNDKDDEDYDVYVGFNNVPDIGGASGASKVAYATKQGIAKVVYVEDADVKGTSDAKMTVIIGDSGSKLIKEGSDEYYEFDAVIDGEITTVKVAKSAVAGGLRTLLTDDKAFVVEKLTVNSKGFITDIDEYDALANGDGKVSYTGTKKAANDVVGFSYDSVNDEYDHSYAYTSDAQVVYRDEDDNLRAGGISLIRTDENDTAIVVLDNNKIIGVFVQEVPAAEATPGFVASDPAPAQPLVVGGTAAVLTNVDWTSAAGADTSSLDGKTLSVSVPGKARTDLTFTVTFTTATVNANDDTKVHVASGTSTNFKGVLAEAQTKLNNQFATYAAEKVAANESYTKVTVIVITGTTNAAITGATGTLQTQEYVDDTSTAEKPDKPSTKTPITSVAFSAYTMATNGQTIENPTCTTDTVDVTYAWSVKGNASATVTAGTTEAAGGTTYVLTATVAVKSANSATHELGTLTAPTLSGVTGTVAGNKITFEFPVAAASKTQITSIAFDSYTMATDGQKIANPNCTTGTVDVTYAWSVKGNASATVTAGTTNAAGGTTYVLTATVAVKSANSATHELGTLTAPTLSGVTGTVAGNKITFEFAVKTPITSIAFDSYTMATDGQKIANPNCTTGTVDVTYAWSVKDDATTTVTAGTTNAASGNTYVLTATVDVKSANSATHELGTLTAPTLGGVTGTVAGNKITFEFAVS